MFKYIKNAFLKKASKNQCLWDILKPFYIILSLLGLFPYSIKFQNCKSRFYIIRKSIYFNSIYALSILLIISYFLTLHIQYIYASVTDNIMTEGVMTQLNYIAELFGLTLFCIIVYISVFNNRFTFINAMNRLHVRIGTSHNNSKVFKYLQYQIQILVMGSLFIITLMQFCVNFTRKDSYWKITLVVLTFNIPQIIQFTALSFFYILIVVVVGTLQNIRYQTIILSNEKKVYMNGLIQVQPKKALTLREMEVIYIEISELKRELNKAFEAPILVTMMQCFHSIVSESHIIYHGVVVDRDLNAHGIVNCSVWIFYQLLKIYAIANAGNIIKLEALKLAQAIHKIPTERQDLRFIMEVQHFSSVISLYGTDLTVYDFFPLDATLLFKVVAAAAMYIIILVQFDKTIQI